MSFKVKDLKTVYDIGHTLMSETEEVKIFPFDKLKVDSPALNPAIYVGVKNNPDVLLVVEGVISLNKKTKGVSILPVILEIMVKKDARDESRVSTDWLKTKIEKPSTNKVTCAEDELFGLTDIGDMLLYNAYFYCDRLVEMGPDCDENRYFFRRRLFERIEELTEEEEMRTDGSDDDDTINVTSWV